MRVGHCRVLAVGFKDREGRINRGSYCSLFRTYCIFSLRIGECR